MNKDDLVALQASIQEQFNNLSDPAWIASQQNQLKGKFDILTNVINSLEEDNAKDIKPTGKTNSVNNKGK